MTDLEPLHPQHVSINMDPPPLSPPGWLARSSKAAVTDLVYFIAPTTELAIKVDPAGGRLVKRSSGRSLMQHLNVPPHHRVGYCRDFFTTIVNSRWYCLVVFFSALYISSWLFFGSVWLGLNIAFTGGGGGNGTCVTHVDDFSSAFLFSIETQMTIGYGFKYIEDNCRSAIVVLIIQCVLGLLIDSFLLGLIFTKLSRPRNRRRTLLFSDCAVVRETEEGRVLEFRIADVRRSQVVEAHVRLQLYWYQDSPRGEGAELRQYDLDVGYDTGRDRVFLLTPVSVRHLITESSPLHGLSREELSSSPLELVVILEGIVEVTGLTGQVMYIHIPILCQSSSIVYLG